MSSSWIAPVWFTSFGTTAYSSQFLPKWSTVWHLGACTGVPLVLLLLPFPLYSHDPILKLAGSPFHSPQGTRLVCANSSYWAYLFLADGPAFSAVNVISQEGSMPEWHYKRLHRNTGQRTVSPRARILQQRVSQERERAGGRRVTNSRIATDEEACRTPLRAHSSASNSKTYRKFVKGVL